MDSAPNPAPAAREARETKLREIRAGLEGVGDGLGYGIESGIIDEVAAMNAAGFGTSGSCEGHVDRALPYPWIDISAPGEAGYRTESRRLAWEGALASVTEATGVTDEREIRTHHWDAMESFLNSYPYPDDEPDLPEYTEWEKRNRQEASRLIDVVRRYAGEPGDGGLITAQTYGSWVRAVGLQESEASLARVWEEQGALFRKFQSDGDNDAFERFHSLRPTADKMEEELSRDEGSVLRRRAAISRFAEWLKERWLSGENFA